MDIYAQIQMLVQKDIDDKIQAYADKMKFSIAQVPAHSHTGVDSGRIEFSDILGVPVIAVAPTDKPENGTIRLFNAGGTRKIYAFISGVWYSATLT